MITRIFFRLVSSASFLVLLSAGAQAALCPSTRFDVTHGNPGNYVWGQGMGCINKPIQQVWNELKTPEAMSFDGSSLDSSTQVSPPSGVLYTYENKYTASGYFWVHWTIDWHHMLKSGTVDQPTQVQVHYEKVSGTDHIRSWQGDIFLQSAGPNATSILLKNQIDADQTSENDAAATLQQLFDKLK